MSVRVLASAVDDSSYVRVSVFDHLQGVTMSSLKSLLLLTTVGCFYAKGGQ